MNVIGFFVSLSGIEPYAIGLFVGFSLGCELVVLFQGDFVFVTKLGSVVTRQGRLVQESKKSNCSTAFAFFTKLTGNTRGSR